MGRSLTGRRCILTGASSGIGRAIAGELARAGVRLVLTARSTDKLATLEQELQTQTEVLSIPADVTSSADRERLIADAVARFGGLDLLVHVAGIASFGHFATSTEAINRQILETNFFAPIELTRLAMPHLTQGNDPRICYLTSMCGRRGMPAWPEYSASKFALVGMAEAFRAEFVRFGVGVTTIVPGLTQTDLNQHMLRNEGKMNIPFGQGMTPEYVAQRTVAAIQQGRREVVLGSEAKKMLLMNRFFPRLLNRLIARRVRQLYAVP
ncbi:MAG: SDR family NAD(P)-dependent oxidoreductase [Bacteroidales bacterium]|nr:SDR family NAD(P)-dependent oxidoreductase [Bacteroidales bacterium]